MKKLIKKKSMSQNQSVNQVVKIVIGDVAKKRKKKKKKKSKSSPQPHFLSRTQPYQIPLYMPAFPQRIHTQVTSDQTKVSNLLRNYMAVNNAELKRLRGDLGAYRIEEQSKKMIAYPKQKVSIESVEGNDFTDEVEDDMNQSAEIEYQDGIRLAPTLSEYTDSEIDNRPDSPSESPSDTDTDWRDKLAMRPNSPVSSPPQSDTDFQTANESPTDVSDIDSATSGDGGGRRVAFSDRVEVSLPPRRGTRKNKNMAEIKRELSSLGIGFDSKVKQNELHEIAKYNSIKLTR